jgi:hypothetical protein
MHCRKNTIEGHIRVTLDQLSPVSNQAATKKQKKKPRKTHNFHWTPESQDLLRQFLAKCALEFGGRKAAKVLESLVKQWVDGKIKVRF